MTTSATAWLGTHLPPLPAGHCYILLEAGPLLPTTGPLGSYTVQGRFLPWDEQNDFPAISDRVVTCPISLHRAGLLIPETRWSAAGYLLSPLSFVPPVETRLVTLPAHRLGARRLHHLFPTADRPAPLQLRDLQGWYLCLDTGAECILLPCFEVTRAFYYAAGPHLISFCLSRLAVDRICWPLASPSETLHQTAHYCIAAHSLRSTEMRLFAELLFQPDCYRMVQRTQARLAQAWAERRVHPERPAPGLHLDWELKREVRVHVRGESFCWQNKLYFLVHALAPAPDWYSFQGVVCHLLGSPATPPALVCFVELASKPGAGPLWQKREPAVKQPGAGAVSANGRSRMFTRHNQVNNCLRVRGGPDCGQ